MLGIVQIFLGLLPNNLNLLFTVRRLWYVFACWKLAITFYPPSNKNFVLMTSKLKTMVTWANWRNIQGLTSPARPLARPESTVDWMLDKASKFNSQWTWRVYSTSLTFPPHASASLLLSTSCSYLGALCQGISATHSISTSAPIGRLATPTHVRAGIAFLSKNCKDSQQWISLEVDNDILTWAYTSFIGLKSRGMSVR